MSSVKDIYIRINHLIQITPTTTTTTTSTTATTTTTTTTTNNNNNNNSNNYNNVCSISKQEIEEWRRVLTHYTSRTALSSTDDAEYVHLLRTMSQLLLALASVRSLSLMRRISQLLNEVPGGQAMLNSEFIISLQSSNATPISLLESSLDISLFRDAIKNNILLTLTALNNQLPLLSERPGESKSSNNSDIVRILVLQHKLLTSFHKELFDKSTPSSRISCFNFIIQSVKNRKISSEFFMAAPSNEILNYFTNSFNFLFSDDMDISHKSAVFIMTLVKLLSCHDGAFSTEELSQYLEDILLIRLNCETTPEDICMLDLNLVQALVCIAPKQFIRRPMRTNATHSVVFLYALNLINAILSRPPVCHSLVFASCRLCTTLVSSFYKLCQDDATALSVIDMHFSTTIMQMVMSIVRSIWNSHYDHIRRYARDVFEETVLLLHKYDTFKSNTILMDIAREFISLNDRSKIKYNYLTCLTRHLSSTDLIRIKPNLPELLLLLMEESALAMHIKDFWSRLICNCQSFTEVRMWLDSIIALLETFTTPHIRNISMYCFNAISNSHVDSLPYLIHNVPLTARGTLFILTCLQRSQHVQCKNKTSPRELISRKVLYFALFSDNQVLALPALSLLCQAQKTSSCVPREDLHVILQATPLLLNFYTSSARNDIIFYFKCLINRIGCSTKRLLSNNNNNNAAVIVSDYNWFILELINLSFSYISPVSSCSSREVCLALLHVISTTFNDSNFRLARIPCSFQLSDILTDDQLSKLLLSLNDSYDVICSIVFEILKSISSTRMKLFVMEHNAFIIKLVDYYFTLLLRYSPIHCVSASYILHFIIITDCSQLITSLKGNLTQYQLANSAPSTPISTSSSCAVLASRILLDILKLQLTLCKDEWRPSQCSLYPMLHSINAILHLTTGDCEFLSDLIDTCHSVSTITSLVVCNSSPEGFLPHESSHLADNFSAPIILLCSWMSVKEISLLFGTISKLFLSNLSRLCLDTISDFYLKHLIEARHRGAFEIACVGFTTYCGQLWSSSFSYLPTQWLNSIISNIKEPDAADSQIKQLSCATRRSAGLPFLITAILANEPKSNRYFILKQTLRELLDIAIVFDSSRFDLTSTIHCYNILTAIFKDYRFREISLLHISAAIKLCVTSISSKQWPIRNASHLLFSAAFSRQFGAKRMQEDSAIQNKMTAHHFFSSHSDLRSLFIDALYGNNDNSINPNIVLILSILSRLYISKAYINYKSPVESSPFICAIFSIIGCSMWRIRQQAANSLTSLISQFSFSQMFLIFIHQYRSAIITSNYLHGMLLFLMSALGIRLPDDVTERDKLIVIKWCVNVYSSPSNTTASVIAPINQCCILDLLARLLSYTACITPIDADIRCATTHVVNSVNGLIDSGHLHIWNHLYYSSLITSSLMFLIKVYSIYSAGLPLCSSISECIAHAIHNATDTTLLLIIDCFIWSDMTSSLNLIPISYLISIITQHEVRGDEVACKIIELLAKLKSFAYFESALLDSAVIDNLFSSLLVQLDRVGIDSLTAGPIIDMFSHVLKIASRDQSFNIIRVNQLFDYLYHNIDAFTEDIILCLSSLLSVNIEYILVQPVDFHTWYILLSVLHVCTEAASLIDSFFVSCKKLFPSLPSYINDLSSNSHSLLTIQLLLDFAIFFYPPQQSMRLFIFLYQHFPITSSDVASSPSSHLLKDEAYITCFSEPMVILIFLANAMLKLINTYPNINNNDVILILMEYKSLINNNISNNNNNTNISWNSDDDMNVDRCKYIKYCKAAIILDFLHHSLFGVEFATKNSQVLAIIPYMGISSVVKRILCLY